MLPKFEIDVNVQEEIQQEQVSVLSLVRTPLINYN